MEIVIGIIGVILALCLCDKLNVGNNKYGIIWIIIAITIVLFICSMIITCTETVINTDVDFRY